MVQIVSKEPFSAQLEFAEWSLCTGRAPGAAGTPLMLRAGMELDTEV